MLNRIIFRFKFFIPFGAVAAVMFITVSCGHKAKLPISAGFGLHPQLPPISQSIVPTVNVVTAKGWQPGAHPTPAAGTTVVAFASGLDHPRWLYVLPNGDVLVAETNAPPRPQDGKGIKGWFFKRYQKKAGGAVPSANRITLLRDADGDGIAEKRSVFLSNLNSPFGMVLVGQTFYVANTDAVVSYPYVEGETQITAASTRVVELPAGPLNHHWTKNIVASPDGLTLYASVGSNSNAAENGLPAEEGRAAIWSINPATREHHIFASGLRNPVGMAFLPDGVLWVAVNERDELGGDLVPDYMTAVKNGAFYGWPYSYFGSNADPRVKSQRPDLIASAVVPDYALGAHTASLGLASSLGTKLPAPFSHGMFVGQHGSWNRKPRSGYKVIFVPFTKGVPSGPPVDVLTGFVQDNGDAMGRPVGVVIDKKGTLLVADDVGNTIWRVAASSPGTVNAK